MIVTNEFIRRNSSATFVLNRGNSFLFNSNNDTNLNQTETQKKLKPASARLIQKHSVSSGIKTVLDVQNLDFSLTISPSITIIFFLLMAGIGSFLKLKIAYAKFKHDKQR